MSVCKERPATLPPLDAIGLEPVDHTHAMSRGGSGHRPPSAVPPSRQASIGLGFNSSALGKPGASNLFSMGNFATGAGSKLSSEERYANSNRAASVSGAPGMQYTSNRPSTMQRTASQGGAGAPLQKRVLSKRGENRNENNWVPGVI
jgi:translation initiation factor 4G